MEFLNRTGVPAMYYENLDQHGELFHVVVVRRSYRLTLAGLVPNERQEPVRDTDNYFDGGSGMSVRQESDLCAFKPRCDVIVNAVAHARARTSVRVLKVRLLVESVPRSDHLNETTSRSEDVFGAAGTDKVSDTTGGSARLIDKALLVTGPRHMVKRALAARACGAALNLMTLGLYRLPPWRLTRPAPFESMPLRYEFAYGGENRIEARARDRARQTKKLGAKVCLTAEQIAQHPANEFGVSAVPVAHVACEANPAGIGFALNWYLRNCDPKKIAAPRIEYVDKPFTARVFWRAARGKPFHAPAGMGAVGRTWLPRRQLIGKAAAGVRYDEADFPSLPSDFDHRYWNCAPLDQQCEHLVGGETVTLVNLSSEEMPGTRLSAEGDRLLCFSLPSMTPYLSLCDVNDRLGAKVCILDTVYIEPEAGIVELVWRAAIPADAALASIQLNLADTAEARSQLENFIRVSELLSAPT